ncbi:MAG: hypothetical protein HQK91_06945 [Nitrospirae bacterium]|nr:hypothetical protein [Nitrospirota bacterium]
MGILDRSNKRDLNQIKPPSPIPLNSINRRSENRYEIAPIPAFDRTAKIDLGVITDISISGLRIKKPSAIDLENQIYFFKLNNVPIKTKLIWQDKKFIGLKVDPNGAIAPNQNKDLIKKLTQKIDAHLSIKKSKTLYESIKRYSNENILASLINLMVELESSETDVIKLKKYIEEISIIHDKIFEKKEQSSLDEDSGIIDEPITQPTQIELIDLQTQLIATANSPEITDGIEVKDIDFAIARIGLAAVKDISARFVKQMISKSENALSNFKGFESYNILKTVMFKKLTPFFSFRDDNGIGCSLLSIETIGIDFLATKTKAALSDFYTSPMNIYSELSRLYERRLNGCDLIKVDKILLETISPVFVSLYDGYIISHQLLNPYLTIEDDITLELNRRKLNYAYLLFMSYLSCQFYIGRDNESGISLINRLTCTGLDKQEILRFLKDTVAEANKIAENFGLKTLIKDSASPSFSLNIKKFLPEDPQYNHLLHIFTNLKQYKRVAIRYEDDEYSHFILNKLINYPDFGLNKMPYTVIPCENLSTKDEIAAEAFNFFGLIIFKNIDKIHGSLAKGFIKLWREYDGIIITTFNNYNFIEFDRPDLFKFLRQHMVDFPSYFANPEIHRKMIEHTAEYLKPVYTIDKDQYNVDYIEKTCSMSFIKAETINQFAEEQLSE